ncbi:hypothetical protein HNQ02_003156 [Flavobacterium sp. 7E]|uniref:hypothetical protein n=1 Tax=unclassified Flavobacterium TaxID=196869 RepID=UPI001A00AB18|nr:hypothetical protein [Flavobacterium sp. PL002]NRS90219.1 hypothetical protein [Flavobacterium sp. 7E]
MSQIRIIIETQGYFFIRLQPEAIIIPKRELDNAENTTENLKALARSLNIEYQENLKWNW